MIFEYKEKYQIIYADPPWEYKVWSKKGQGRSAVSHYPVMTKQDIKDLGELIKQVIDKNCILFLWVTPPNLLEGIETIHSWGFEYKTKGFNWVKRNKKADSWFWGLGHYTRANSEDCLIATKGRIKRVGKDVHQVLDDRIMEHSRKPSEVRDRIVRLVGDLPRLELFATEKAEGWDSMGWEVTKRDIREDLKLKINSLEVSKVG